MSIRTIGLAGLLLAELSVPAAAQNAHATLKNAEGKDVGATTLTQTPSGVLIAISVQGCRKASMPFMCMLPANASRPSPARAAISIPRARSTA